MLNDERREKRSFPIESSQVNISNLLLKTAVVQLKNVTVFFLDVIVEPPKGQKYFWQQSGNRSCSQAKKTREDA